MNVERSIDIRVPPEEVYDVIMDPRRLGDWVTIHEGLKSAPAGALRKGSRLEQSLKVAGRRFDVRWTVTEATRPSHVVWQGEGPVRTRARVAYELEPTETGTRFAYANEYELPGGRLGVLAGRAVAGRAAKETEQTLERLKALLEG